MALLDAIQYDMNAELLSGWCLCFFFFLKHLG